MTLLTLQQTTVQSGMRTIEAGGMTTRDMSTVVEEGVVVRPPTRVSLYLLICLFMTNQ